MVHFFFFENSGDDIKMQKSSGLSTVLKCTLIKTCNNIKVAFVVGCNIHS